ncbi:MAG: DUF4149 domain-containing protein [Alphaproteobacteria bacterium]|nr:DUF4149 domain-containing protein [Alphaproteobacteria bacterium SS10]
MSRYPAAIARITIMNETITVLLDLTLGCLLGAMIFFPSVVAPTVFKVLSGADAGKFLRRLFVGYYTYLIIASGIGALLLFRDPIAAAAIGAITISTLWVKQILMPKLNAWRDAELEGDEEAKVKFAKGHHLSVIINVTQMLVLIAVIIARGAGYIA